MADLFRDNILEHHRMMRGTRRPTFIAGGSRERVIAGFVIVDPSAAGG